MPIHPPSPARSVAGVLARLDRVVDDARSARSTIGYFAALYRRVTRAIAEGIAADRFDDGARMDRIDTDFANRYFSALRAHLAGRRVPEAWRVAFGAAAESDGAGERDGTIVLQHLLAGINAHINADLGAATAAICPGRRIAAVRRDFFSINRLLADMTGRVQEDLASVSPRIGALDVLGGSADERLATFSMNAARDDAWRLAVVLAAAPAPLRPAIERIADEKAAFLGRVIVRPPGAVRAAVEAVRTAETRDHLAVLDVLAAE